MRKLLVLMTMSHGVNHMYFESLGPLLPFFIVAFNLNHVQAGRLGLIYFLLYGLFNFPSGYWCDKYGKRLFVLMFLLISSAATALMTLATSYIQLLILCGLAGIGGGLYHPAGTALISENIPPKKRGMSLGIHASGGSFGVLVSFLIIAGIGGRWNLDVALICLSGIGLTLALYFRMFSWDIGEQKRDTLFDDNKNFVIENHIGSWEIIKSLPLMMTLYATVMFLFKGAYTWIPMYIKETFNMTPSKSIIFAIIIPIMGIFSNTLMGKFSDRYGRKVSLILVFSALAVCFFLFYIGSRKFLIPLLFVFGFFINSFSGIINAYLADLMPPETLGRAFGIIFTFSICVSSLSPYIMGFIADYSSISTSMLFLGVIALSGVFISLITPKKYIKPVLG